jgi:RNA polymerase sigma-54 factor
MAALRQKQTVETKTKLSGTLRNWLPILHASLGDLGEAMAPFVEANPLVEVESGFEESFERKIPKAVIAGRVSNSRTEQIEALTVTKKSIYAVLAEQIDAPLFPTPESQMIATFVLENLDENGYYEGDTRAFCEHSAVSVETFERVRRRFALLEPPGIGAADPKESFLFQLECAQISDEGYALAATMIKHLDALHEFSDEPFFGEAMKVIGRFKNPPAIDYFEDSPAIVPDLMIFTDEENQIVVKLNESCYPTIRIDTDYGVKHAFVSQKINEAKSLVDALQMRKATLYKVGLMIVEYQYEFFNGGMIRPLTLKTLADEFGHNPSTISRAIANKYIACDRGIYAMKEFFTTAVDTDVSNAAIKAYLAMLVRQEPRNKPLSDMKLLQRIEEEFGIKLVRRTIAKYRQQLNIAGSSERKKLYRLEVE